MPDAEGQAPSKVRPALTGVDERALRRWRIAYVVGIVLIMLLVAAIAIPNLMATRIASNDSIGIASLRAYASAQNEFRRADRYGIGRKVYANPKDGSGFRDLYHIGYDGTSVPDKPVLGFIDQSLAGADIRMGKASSKAGYLFTDITADANGPYDFSKQCGLCAVPAQYLCTGRYTYIVDASGRIYQKNVRHELRAMCEPVTTWPDVEKEGWLPVGE